jgi:hypothetical protein
MLCAPGPRERLCFQGEDPDFRAWRAQNRRVPQVRIFGPGNQAHQSGLLSGKRPTDTQLFQPSKYRMLFRSSIIPGNVAVGRHPSRSCVSALEAGASTLTKCASHP